MSMLVQVKQLLFVGGRQCSTDAAVVTSRIIAPVITMLTSVTIVNKWHIGIKKPALYEHRVIPRHSMTLIVYSSLLYVKYIIFIDCQYIIFQLVMETLMECVSKCSMIMP